MEDNVLRIAIISDLHCHPEKENFKDNNTLLFSDKLRLPSNEHPVENLLEVIDEKKLKVDLVLSPGDFTDHSDKQGFFSGWNYVNEVARALKAKEIIATIGNHDVDSRHTYSKYSFDIPKKIQQNFPIRIKEKLSMFWDKGYVILEEESYQILVINSTHFHTHYEKNNPIENPAIKGKVEESQIEEIGKYLTKNNYSHKIKIALCHHHPIEHSRLKLGEHDVIENGAALMSLLGKFKFDIVVHGHKHDPWLRYFPTEERPGLPVLSAGSFSATNQISWISKFNYFHILEINKKQDKSIGKLETWTFKQGGGWNNNKEDGFYPYTGFGFSGELKNLQEKIIQLFSTQEMINWETLVSQIPEIENLIPDEMEMLQSNLESKKIYFNAKLGLKPKHIYFDKT